MISVAPAVFGVALVAGSTLGGRLTDRFGAFPVVVIGLAALTPAKLAVSFATASPLGLPPAPPSALQPCITSRQGPAPEVRSGTDP